MEKQVYDSQDTSILDDRTDGDVNGLYIERIL